LAWLALCSVDGDLAVDFDILAVEQGDARNASEDSVVDDIQRGGRESILLIGSTSVRSPRERSAKVNLYG